MIRTLLTISLFALAAPAFAQDNTAHNSSTSYGSGSHFGDQGADHAGHDHKADDHASHTMVSDLALTRTPEIDAALAAGGEPVVVKVLGAVCDFCATAMNKTFGRRDDVSAVHVDLDAKTLNLVLIPGAEMDDKRLRKLVKKSGYKADDIARGAALSQR